jgi:hypothetical protein
MSTARHMLALLKSHVHGNDQEFFSVAMQVAAHEARLGHGKLPNKSGISLTRRAPERQALYDPVRS